MPVDNWIMVISQVIVNLIFLYMMDWEAFCDFIILCCTIQYACHWFQTSYWCHLLLYWPIAVVNPWMHIRCGQNFWIILFSSCFSNYLLNWKVINWIRSSLLSLLNYHLQLWRHYKWHVEKKNLFKSINVEWKPFLLVKGGENLSKYI